MKRYAFVLAMLLATLPVGAEGAEVTGQFEFARARFANFDVHASTGWRSTGGPPFVDEIGCWGSSSDMSFGVDAIGGIQFLSSQFLREPDEQGERERGAHLGDTLWLFVDRDRFEYRSIPAGNGRFLNYPYPPMGAPEEILPVWTGHSAIRRGDDEAFRPLSSIYELMVEAERLEWSLKERDPTAQLGEAPMPRGHRFPIENAGLRDAVAWCRLEVASAQALTLPAEIVERFPAAK
jgi:hypothetical protein